MPPKASPSTRTPARRAPAASTSRSSCADVGMAGQAERLADLGVQGDLDVLLVAVAEHGEGERLARLVRADRHDQCDAVGDRLALEGDDDVALLEACVVGGRAVDDLVDLGAGAVALAGL